MEKVEKLNRKKIILILICLISAICLYNFIVLLANSIGSHGFKIVYES